MRHQENPVPKSLDPLYENGQLQHLTCAFGYPVNFAILVCKYIEQAVRSSFDISYPPKTLAKD